jgi:uracil-DNA glycosylase
VNNFEELLTTVRACAVCAPHLPLGPRPIVRLAATNRILITSQAPGTHAHAANRPFNDVSGDRLRTWLGTPEDTFYGPHIGFMPMGFCYPGRGTKGHNPGDNPPRPECAPLWHHKLRSFIPNIRLTLLVGAYAQHFYLPEQKNLNLTERCLHWLEHQGPIIPLVHPSPRNLLWCKRNPWFESEMVPLIQQRISAILSEQPKVKII